jgi:hypothetical protein
MGDREKKKTYSQPFRGSIDMNTTLKNTLAAIAATSALISVSAPAYAFGFGTNGISFEQDTTVNFTFGSSNGGKTSSLGVYEVKNGFLTNVAALFWETKASDKGGEKDYKATFGNSVTSSTGKSAVSFTFLANTVYSLGLYSGNFNASTGLTNTVFKAGTYDLVSSTSSVNFQGQQQAVFGSNINIDKKATTPFDVNNGAVSNYTSGNLLKGLTIGFEDRVFGSDKDYNDFSVTASVPEPFTMSGLALGLGGLVTMRRRQQKKASS